MQRRAHPEQPDPLATTRGTVNKLEEKLDALLSLPVWSLAKFQLSCLVLPATPCNIKSSFGRFADLCGAGLRLSVLDFSISSQQGNLVLRCRRGPSVPGSPANDAHGSKGKGGENQVS